MVPTTIYVHLRLPRIRRLLESITILPIVIPPVVLIVGVLEVAPGYLKSTPYLLGLVYVILAMPFAYRSLDAGLRALELRTLVDAASSLGAGWLSTLLRVILPNLRTVHHGGADSPLKRADTQLGISRWLGKYYGIVAGTKARVGATLGALARLQLGVFRYVLSGQKIDGTQ